jgi:hypothetical protein
MVMHIRTICQWTVLLDLFELFDLEVKGQGPTKVITVRDTPPYGPAHTNYLPINSFVGFIWIISPSGQRSRSLRHATHRLMVIHPYTNYHLPISKDKNVMAQTRTYFLKNNYLTLMSKVKVPWRSLRYVTHPLMVMHIRTICPWTVLLYLFELFDLEVKGQGPIKVITVRNTPPCGYAPTYQLSLTYLERQKRYGLDKLRWEEAEEAEEKIRLKQ